VATGTRYGIHRILALHATLSVPGIILPQYIGIALAPLSTNASKYLEGKTYPTSNLVLPSIYGCIHMLKSTTPVRRPWNGEALEPSALRPEVSTARELLYKDLVTRWVRDIPPERKRFYYIATVCDPRQKALRFPGVSPQDRETALDWFEAEYISFYAGSDVACATVAAATPGAPGPSKLSKAAHSQHAASSFLDFMANLASVSGRDVLTTADGEEEDEPPLENEARRYLSLPDASMNTDILDWWARHQTTFPNLSVMAQQCLGAPATSASAERLFSIAGRVFSDNVAMLISSSLKS